SVTTLARVQWTSAKLVHVVGRLTLTKVVAASVERNSPLLVARNTVVTESGSAATRKLNAPSGAPVAFCHVTPSSIERYTPRPGEDENPKAGSPVAAMIVPLAPPVGR